VVTRVSEFLSPRPGVISSSPLTVLRLDEEGVTVRDDDRVVRFRIAGT
jgi:hypothetical protein